MITYYTYTVKAFEGLESKLVLIVSLKQCFQTQGIAASRPRLRYSCRSIEGTAILLIF